MVIRNNQGLIMGAMCKLLEFPLGALEAKVKAMEAGIDLAWDLGLKHIILKGDAQLIIHALKGYVAPPKTILKIIEGSRNFSQKFSSWKVVHTNRINNSAANVLAREAKTVDKCVIWDEDSLPCIENQLMTDVIAMEISPHQ